MSSPTPTGGSTTTKILAYLFLASALVAFPVAGYFLGGFIGAHMAYSDVMQGYSYAGLFQTYYNSTHISQYNQIAQISSAMGITLGSTDTTTLEIVGLGMGLILDLGVAIVGINEIKKLD